MHWRLSSINVLAGTVVGLYKTECAETDGLFRTADELEPATLSSVHWLNDRLSIAQSDIGRQLSTKPSARIFKQTPRSRWLWDKCPRPSPERFIAEVRSSDEDGDGGFVGDAFEADGAGNVASTAGARPEMCPPRSMKAA